MGKEITGYSRNAEVVAKLLGGALLVLAGLALGAVLLIVIVLPLGNDGISRLEAFQSVAPFAGLALWPAFAGFVTLRVARNAIWARTVWLTGFGLFLLGIAPFVALVAVLVAVNRF